MQQADPPGRPGGPVVVARTDTALDRLRRSADAARTPGARVAVSGADIAAVIGYVDELRVAVAEAGGAAPRPRRGAGASQESRGSAGRLLEAADDILANHADLWGQPLLRALPEWAESTGGELPRNWESLVDG